MINKRNLILIEKELNQNYKKCIEKIKNKPYKIDHKQLGKYHLFKYNENMGCDFSKRIVRESRSIILKEIGNSRGNKSPRFKRVAVPFFKFFNYTEQKSKKVTKEFRDKQLYGYEKIDGSIISMWYDDNQWHISTSGNIDANKAPLYDVSIFKTYGELFTKCLENTNLDFNKLNKNCTYMFELISPYNRVVVTYNNYEIYHIGTRNNNTLLENFDYIGVQQPKCILFKNIKEAIKYVSLIDKNNKNYEGIVLRDNKFNRVKIKTELWFELSKMKNNGVLNNNRIFKMIQDGSVNEFISYFPEFSNVVNDMKDRINLLYEILKKEIFEIDYNKDLKSFCDLVRTKSYSCILINAYKNNIKNLENKEIEQWIDNQIKKISTKKYLDIIGKIK